MTRPLDAPRLRLALSLLVIVTGTSPAAAVTRQIALGVSVADASDPLRSIASGPLPVAICLQSGPCGARGGVLTQPSRPRMRWRWSRAGSPR